MFAASTKMRPRFEQVVIVTRMTQLESLLVRFNTKEQARFYLEHAGEDFDSIDQEHQRYHHVLNSVRDTVPQGIKSIVIERQFLPQYLFGVNDLVIIVGQDGLVVNTAKYLQDQPILAVNPMPDLIDGVLLPFNERSVSAGFEKAMYGEFTIKDITMVEARLNDGQKLLGVNDLFIGANSHVSARYEIHLGNEQEFHSSSGIIVSTGAGSTGWLQSVYAGAAGVITALGGEVVAPKNHGRMDWSANQLIYAVREPFPSKSSQAKMVYGTITPEHPLVLHSHMAENGVIFSDGIESDFLAFQSGSIATIAVADKKSHLIVA